MKFIDQTTFGMPGGNCFSACLASLLDISIEDVPYFNDPPAHRWFLRAQAWLRPQGLYIVTYSFGHGFAPDGLHILGGHSPRDPEHAWLHAVIAEGDRIVHDPHPSRAGLVDRVDYTLLVPLNPSSCRATR